MFPFGHGLSYTQFGYGSLRVSPSEINLGGRISVEIGIENLGTVAGEETCFLFVRDPVATVARPLLELRGIAKIRLDPGQRGTVRFELAPRDLAFPDEDGIPKLEAGAFEILAGPSAVRGALLCQTISLALPAQG